MTGPELRRTCEGIFAACHHPRYISPDPLEVVREYCDPAQREIAAFIASALSLGRVEGIVAAVREVLYRIAPPDRLLSLPTAELIERSAPFVYRFFDGRQLAGLLLGVQRLIGQFGSLEACFAGGVGPDGADALGGARRLVDALVSAADGRLDRSILVARPQKGSACKRLLLFLRWMVRRDAVDPGGWTVIAPSALLVPMDTHMLAISRALGLTRASQPSLSVVREVTAAFRSIRPDDPVRYDFSLTRTGIHPVIRRTQPPGIPVEWVRS